MVRWKPVIALFAGAAIGAAIMAGFAAQIVAGFATQRAEEFVREAAGLRLDSPERAAQMFQLFATDPDLSLIRDGPHAVRLVAPEKPE
jgi:hypothetical protein